jgi:hypothetical protein
MIVSSGEGGGLHGHLGIIMTNDEYFAFATEVFPSPVNMGGTATIVMGMTATQIMETKRAQTEAMRVYKAYHNIDQALKKFIIDAFEDPFLN